MNFLKKIRNFLIIFTLFGVLTAGLDYLRMNSGLAPIFNISKFNEKTRIQSYRGLFYQASRKVKVSTNEPTNLPPDPYSRAIVITTCFPL